MVHIKQRLKPKSSSSNLEHVLVQLGNSKASFVHASMELTLKKKYILYTFKPPENRATYSSYHELLPKTPQKMADCKRLSELS